MIQVHPQIAYLNSPVTVTNKINQKVQVYDKMTGESFVLGPGDSKISRYSAGIHEIVAKSSMGMTESLRIKVEDALKFGGSERKKCYVFEGNPWAIIVMKDRTYFFNEKTGEQFVEHTFSPDAVEELNEDYLLFKTERELSFYSLRTMSVEKTFSNMKKVYSGKNHCVLYGNGKLIVYRLNPEAAGIREKTVECDAYVIQRFDSIGEGIIRYHRKQAPNMVEFIRVFDEKKRNLYEKDDFEVLGGEFVCFPSPGSVLFTHRGDDVCKPTPLYCAFFSNTRIVIVHEGDIPISEVNGITIWENEEYERLETEDVEGEATKRCLTVLENSGQIYRILTTHRIKSTKQTVVSKTKGTYAKYRREKSTVSVFYDSMGNALLKRPAELSFQHEGNLDYVTGDEKVFIIGDDSITTHEGRLCFTDYEDPYLIRRIDRTDKYYTLKDEEISYVKKNSFSIAGQNTNPAFGLFFMGNGKYYWLKTGREYPGNEVRTFSLNPKPAVVSGGGKDVGPRFFMKSGDILPIPIPEKEIIALSRDGRAVLYEKGGLFGIARYCDNEWIYNSEIRLSIYDALHVKDAVFCSDGEGFIYQKKNKLVLYDFLTESETEFDTDKGIQNNVNGYRPYCTKDYFSRPVIVDPISRKTIDHNFLSQYNFSNSDGSVYFVKRIIRYYLKKTEEQLSKEEYEALCKEYDYPQNPFGLVKIEEERSNRRIKYLESIGRKLTPGERWTPADLEMMTANFVDCYIVDKKEFAIISRNGVDVEVPIGAPLYYLNYVAFSADSKRVAIAGKYRDASGICVVFDMERNTLLHHSIMNKDVGRTKAIWLASFSKNNIVAYYDSTPDTYLVKEELGPEKIKGKSFLTFSPSGRFLALSEQGYVPFESGELFWGHVPSCDIFIADIESPQRCLCHFNDHGAGIVGTGTSRNTVATASFSSDETKILSVSNDGVVVVRNLHLR